MPETSATLRLALMINAASGFLDAYTFLVRGGVFANVQTGNVILLALAVADGNLRQGVAHLLPVLAFMAGIAVAAHLQSGGLDDRLPHPMRWAVVVQVLILLVVGLLPATVPPFVVTVPIAFLGALQLALFRRIGPLPFMSVATTGNLARWVEAGYARVVRGDHAAGTAWRTYSWVVTAFVAGSVVGALCSRALGVRASWVPAALIAVTLLFFVLDERRSSSRPE